MDDLNGLGNARQPFAHRPCPASGFPAPGITRKTLSFAHPLSGAKMDFSAEMPADMAGLIALIDNAITERGLPQ